MKQFFLRKKITLPEWEFDIVVIVTLFVGAIFGVYAVLTGLFPNIFAAGDTSEQWDFATPSNYTLSDDTQIEITGSSVRLKVREYADDANTALLMHVNESSGTDVSDSSSNGNNGIASNESWATGILNNGIGLNGTTSYISVPDSASLSLSQSNTLEAWTKFDTAFSEASHYQRQGVIDKGVYQLYYDNETGKIVYEIADGSAVSWTQVAGNNLNGSWPNAGQRDVESMNILNANVYVGLGDATGDAEVWEWDGSEWTKVGGNGVNGSWAVNQFESVFALTNDGTNLYAGLGVGAGDGEVWRWDGNTWTKVGGDAQNGSWPVNTIEGVYSMYYQNATLYVGTGITADDAEVWSCTDCDSGSPIWAKIGGDNGNNGTNDSWTGADNIEVVNALAGDGTNIYAGTGASINDAEVWQWNGSTWSKIGGDGVNFSWNTDFEYVQSLVYAGTSLYAGLGSGANDAEVWRYTGGSWTKIGGDTLNSGWGANYEYVYNLITDGTDIYAGLGLTAGENEVWQCSNCATSPSWVQIGGDAIDGSFTNTHTIVSNLAYADSTLYAGVQTTSAQYAAQVWTYRTTDSPKWTMIGGNYLNESWGFRGLNDVEVMHVSGDKLYAGTGYQYIGNALVWEFDGTNWTLIGGQGINSSWGFNTYERVTSMISYKGNLYIGLGVTANDAEVWMWNGTVWTQVGGDSLNLGWLTNYEEVLSLSSFGGYLFAGLGNTNNDSEIWRWDEVSWTKVAGDTVNSSWPSGTEQVLALSSYKGKLYAGLGNGDSDAEVWQCTGCETGTPTWLKVGGDGANSSWLTSDVDSYNNVDSLIVYNNLLVAGLGNEAGEAAVYTYDGATWVKIGGDDVNNSWTNGTYERVRTTVVYNGDLYAGLGNTAGDGEVWRWNGTTWTQIAGDSLNSSWPSTIEEVNSFSYYKGKLYAGLGNTANADASIWAYGNNAVLTSTTATFDTNWHHIAATYDGTTMRIFIDGALDSSITASRSIPDSNHAVLIGTTYAGREFGKPQGYFEGMLDEIRISNTVRQVDNLIYKPYAVTTQTAHPTTAVFTENIKNWEDFNVTLPEDPEGTITYRLSSNNGTSWQYWDGDSWEASASTTQANDPTTITNNIDTFAVTTGGILWQAILSGDGNEQPEITTVEITATSDTDNPTTPTALTPLSGPSGSPITTDTWYSHASPQFTWPEAEEVGGASDSSGSGVIGYYVYFGTDNTATPSTAGVFQADTTFTASNLTSGQVYYLRIQARDNAQNVSNIWAPFIYKYDATAPSNPGGLSVSPSGYSGTNDYTFFWSTPGSDLGSGLAGYQYKTGASTGPFSDWSSTITATSVNLVDVAYQENENVFYLRTVDNAGNIAGTTIQVSFYYAGEAPTAPQNLMVTPSGVSTTNAFSFEWDPPATYSGTQNEIRYCYTINTLPSNATCTFTAPGVTALAQDAYANQPGANTLYLVARDNVGNINYDAHVSVTFTANTPAPGIPLNVEIADISVKTTESWKLALSWEAPQTNQTAVSSYQVHQSTDGETFTFASSTNGIAYIGTELQQTTYYYKVRACDNSNNCGAFTEPVSMYPDGRFTEPASLVNGPEVTDITTRRALISWITDRNSDTRIRYGLASGDYFEEEPSNSNPKTHHELSLNNLTPGTRYFLVAKWTDEDGNVGTSDEFTFETTAAPTIKSVSVPSTTLSAALVQFTSVNASGISLYYGKGAVLGASKTIDTSLGESTYTILLEELEDGTSYSFRINSIDADGFEYEGTVFEFTTLPRPRISNVEIQEVRGTAQPSVVVRWETNVETTSIVSYYPTNNSDDALDRVNLTRTQGVHEQLITALLPNTAYTLVARGIDSYGNEAQSDPQIFTTSVDTRPPRITNLQVDTTIQRLQTDGASLAQIIVTWNTDELATSQLEYGEGTGASYTQKTQEDINPKTNHSVVISGLSPSRVYHLRAVSQDDASNIGHSVDTVTITPKVTSNALDLVISNLSEIFGFLRNL